MGVSYWLDAPPHLNTLECVSYMNISLHNCDTMSKIRKLILIYYFIWSKIIQVFSIAPVITFTAKEPNSESQVAFGCYVFLVWNISIFSWFSRTLHWKTAGQLFCKMLPFGFVWCLFNETQVLHLGEECRGMLLCSHCVPSGGTPFVFVSLMCCSLWSLD